METLDSTHGNQSPMEVVSSTPLEDGFAKTPDLTMLLATNQLAAPSNGDAPTPNLQEFGISTALVWLFSGTSMDYKNWYLQTPEWHGQPLVNGSSHVTKGPKCQENMVCQINREHVVGSRILPESILLPPNLGGSSSSPLVSSGCSGKSYGISDEQKKDIADRLKTSGCINVELVDKWSPCQWDYFNDLCTLVGLDPDYCIEDVDSDTENGNGPISLGYAQVGYPEKLPVKITGYGVIRLIQEMILAISWLAVNGNSKPVNIPVMQCQQPRGTAATLSHAGPTSGSNQAGPVPIPSTRSRPKLPCLNSKASVQSPNQVDTRNREYTEGVQVLPSSIMSPPKPLLEPVLVEREIKDYCISNAQKMAITSRLCGPSKAVRAADMDSWEQGEHDFFEDQVKAMGLDYDYCIEDVDSDDDNVTSRFFAAQMKVGMPKVPLPTPLIRPNDLWAHCELEFTEGQRPTMEYSMRDINSRAGPNYRTNFMPIFSYMGIQGGSDVYFFFSQHEYGHLGLFEGSPNGPSA
ncbi:hypothetical protein L1987_01185 [Smallanthus sonchifolius]|uniref:Uncharacterized protein n=1 Tax=Smallanthus sonchifolius TaxID=185202 RepID=A0ACB9K4C7_9ASTR|nr:hypothetical protein L1987_01185 [Smallanthus sonchifolius]